MYTLYIQVKVFVLKLERKHKERNGIVPELNQFREAEIAKGGSKPKNKSHEFEFRVDCLFEDKMKGKGIKQAKTILEKVVLDDVSINIECIMSVVVSDKGVN